MKLQSASYQTTGKFPVIDQSQDAICGWTDDVQAVVEGPLPLIVFGDHTCALKFVETPFAQGADGIKILTAKPAVSIQYLFHSLSHRPLVMEDYRRHFSTLKERRVFFPNVESGEQQKIADCLTSLDEVIAAQGRKVEALKAHKRGLMQQLFPREGETRPSLRFPEFRDALEWKPAILADVCRPQQWQTISSSELTKDGYAVYGANGLIGRYPSFNHEFETVAVTCRGSTCGEVLLIPPKSYITGNAMCLDEIDPAKHSHHFIFHLLRHRGLRDVISGSAQPQIVGQAIRKLKISLPNLLEQQRIADCLSSLDTIITSETNQLAALKTHKQGLMQQLFPT